MVLSGETTKATLNLGIQLAVEEVCLPVKVFYGHVMELCNNKVDAIFVPRLISVERGAYICPKFMGLPDMIRPWVPQGIRLIQTTVNLRDHPWIRLSNAAIEVARELGHGKARALEAMLYGISELKRFEKSFLIGNQHREDDHKPLIGILGHPYNLHDSLTNMNLIQRLTNYGFHTVGPESVNPSLISRYLKRLPKDIFWTFGRKIMGSALYWMDTGRVSGIIHVVSFGCGTDSLVGELVSKLASRSRKMPFLLLTIDEHTAEAGLVTRVEAFLDMIRFTRMDKKWQPK